MKKSEAIERYETVAREGITGSFEHVESLFAEAVGRGVPWDPEVDLRPCPNPECVGVAETKVWPGRGWHATCEGCRTSGPYSDEEAEAIRLWNLLPRTQDEVPAGDPGERELPRKLKICTSSSNDGRAIDLVWENSTFDDFEQHLAVYREAAARYKAISEILGRDRGLVRVVDVDRILQREREELR